MCFPSLPFCDEKHINVISYNTIFLTVVQASGLHTGLKPGKIPLTEHQGAVFAVHRQGVALGIAALNDGLGDEGLHTALDEPLDGTCTVDAVVGRINDKVLGGGGDLQLEVLSTIRFTSARPRPFPSAL